MGFTRLSLVVVCLLSLLCGSVAEAGIFGRRCGARCGFRSQVSVSCSQSMTQSCGAPASCGAMVATQSVAGCTSCQGAIYSQVPQTACQPCQAATVQGACAGGACAGGTCPQANFTTQAYQSIEVNLGKRTPVRNVISAVAGGIAQRKAEAMARMGRMSHNVAGFPTCIASYEGVGFSSVSSEAAIRQCCYWGQRTPVDIGVAQGPGGWYACVGFR